MNNAHVIAYRWWQSNHPNVVDDVWAYFIAMNLLYLEEKRAKL